SRFDESLCEFIDQTVYLKGRTIWGNLCEGYLDQHSKLGAPEVVSRGIPDVSRWLLCFFILKPRAIPDKVDLLGSMDMCSVPLKVECCY
ncbi:hypothetical protein A2U01_0070461, partial [Trifolium medium]|nr:hypothetical protein [Trifolium medium]